MGYSQILVIIIIIFLLNLTTKVLTFLGIEFSTYMIYVCWILALTVFYYILPKKYKHFIDSTI